MQAQMLGLIDVFGLHHVVLDAVWTLRYSRARYAFEAIDWYAPAPVCIQA
jgi:hypothetical protein